MSRLREFLQNREIDQIEDDEMFCREEYDAVYQYCKDTNFKLDEADLQEIINRGLEDSFEFWKDCEGHK